ncbi:DUF58 domain-containing protein [Tissierella carlieri]|uniref:DUF58 domain-containing protein n=1 Tax=Tissierella carlieri TaxID=689904 RepID=A0ABT1S919_9FIRM|nr:DUF58 domain-containing protein [Tissierella carlieri]MCQ4922517.1 DUF58 domain-containing protein [Tissierella carlieri]
MIWFLIGLIGVTYLINKATLYYGFRNLTYKMEVGKNTFEIGEEIEIVSIIENKKPLTISFLSVEEKFPKGFNLDGNIYTLFIMPYQRVKRTYKISGEKRGLYRIKDVNLELGDFVGFNKSYEDIEIKRELIIFPKKIDLNESISPIGSLNGDISVKRWIIDDPLMTIGIREYTGNEPQKLIHWPSSAKYNNLMVKNFDFTTDNSVLIVLNIESAKPYWRGIDDDRIEKAISITRAVMEEFEKLRIPYGLASNACNAGSNYIKGHFYHPGLGANHLYHFLEILGSMSYTVSFTFEETLKNISRRQGNYTTVAVITPKILESYIEPINFLGKTVNKTVVISVDDKYLEDLNKSIIRFRGD